MSDTSSFYDTSYSEDQRIDSYIKNLKQKERQQFADIQAYRNALFNNTYAQKIEPIFSLPGLHFLYYNHKYIKFYFKPCDTVSNVNKKTEFYCKLKYIKKFNWWSVKRDSFPVNYKRKIYSLFDEIDDDHIVDVIVRIYKILVTWSKKEQDYRQDKFRKYKRGELEDSDMDSDDQDIFFDEETKSMLRDKRNAVLKRMLPPDKRRDFENIEKILFSKSTSVDSD